MAEPKYTASIAAADGLVVGGGYRIHRLLPGGTHFQQRDVPEGFGDVLCNAVEPRRPGHPQRFAAATIDALHVFDGKAVASVPLSPDEDEPRQILWAPRAVDGDPTYVLYVRFDQRVLQLVPARAPGSVPFDIHPLEGTFAALDGIATDGAGAIAYAIFDEDTSNLDVWLAADLEAGQWLRRSVPVDWADSRRIELAVAGRAVAVSFETGGVWLTRDITDHDFAEVEVLRSMPWVPGGTPRGGAIAFEGSARGAALFGAVRESETLTQLARVDADGGALCIGEVNENAGAPHGGLGPIQAMAWDETRRTLWSAAGNAGILCTTAPGAPIPLGRAGAARAAS